MAPLYDRVWTWSDAKKRKQLTSAASRFLIAHEASTGRAPLGYVNYRFEQDEGEAVLYCYELQVARAAQGRGLGHTLMELAEQIAWGAGMSKVMLTVFRENTTAIKFYIKRGYRLDETSPDYSADRASAFGNIPSVGNIGGIGSGTGGSGTGGSGTGGSGSGTGGSGTGGVGSGTGGSSAGGSNVGCSNGSNAGGSGVHDATAGEEQGYHIMSKQAPPQAQPQAPSEEAPQPLHALPQAPSQAQPQEARPHQDPPSSPPQTQPQQAQLQTLSLPHAQALPQVLTWYVQPEAQPQPLTIQPQWLPHMQAQPQLEPRAQPLARDRARPQEQEQPGPHSGHGRELPPPGFGEPSPRQPLELEEQLDCKRLKLTQEIDRAAA